ncbi:hypothetical protein Acr_00g0021300 [Actinidia rufa]|uniref:Uncharacterized protein n=1 Tax=Actinidia rufa TaxID=165716 RepID=A0A7J0DCD9_9ERIC|nr:hypothetical protein Acr_00g0021300 [Actinidia rufa]
MAILSEYEEDQKLTKPSSSETPTRFFRTVKEKVDAEERKRREKVEKRAAEERAQASASAKEHKKAAAAAAAAEGEKTTDGKQDSWSFENDIPSGEGISNNSRDYTTEFTTNQIFASREDMINWARTIGLKNGIVVVIKKSANLKGGKLPKCHLMCDRGGKYKPPRYLVDGQSLKRNTGTKKCECPFELRGIPIPPNGVMWGLRVVCGFHNHQSAECIDGHEYPCRLKPMEKEFVRDMANSTAPREILSILKERDPSNTTRIRSIYNAIYTDKSAKRHCSL